MGERRFCPKNKREDQGPPFAAYADAQLTPGSCRNTTWRSHVLPPPVYVTKTLCGRPLGTNLNPLLSLMRQQAFWLARANRPANAILLTFCARLERDCRSRADREMMKALPKRHRDLQPFYLKLNQSA
jgi:hypothetical protein